MKVYLLKGSKIEGAGYLFKYNEHGHLVSFEAGEEAGVEKLNWLYANLPVTIENLGQMKQLIKRKNLAASITEVKPDLSFQAFWEKYDHKKGRKTNVRRVWEDMEEVDRAAAMQYIKKYNFYLLDHPNQTRLYPQTYLNRKEWEN